MGPGGLNEAWRPRLGPLGSMVRLGTGAGVVAGRLISADLESGVVVELGEGRACRLSLGSIVSFDAEGTNEGV